MRDLSRQWSAVEEAIDLKTDESASEHVKLMAKALNSMAEIVKEHRTSFERYRSSRRSVSERSS